MLQQIRVGHVIFRSKQSWVHYHTAKQKMIRGFHSTASPLSSAETCATRNEKTMHKCVQFYSYQMLFHINVLQPPQVSQKIMKRHNPHMLTLLLVWKSKHLGHIIFVAVYTAERLC